MIRPLVLAGLCAAAGGALEAGEPFPVELGGPFRLVDDTGASRTEAAPGRDVQLLFFGYANCEQICSAALPLMGAATDLLRAQGHSAVPVMVTVDPARDRVGTMAAKLSPHHPDFVGLTGSPEALGAVYELFAVEAEVLFHDPAGAPVYAHGSHIYVLDGAGRFLTLVPPVLAPERVATIAAGYLGD